MFAPILASGGGLNGRREVSMKMSQRSGLSGQADDRLSIR